LSIEAKNDGKK
jgi:signal peptidase II (EC:3.4.23.36). Aspartic peptidase. MEROPS family A08